MKNLLLLLGIILTVNCYSQIVYEQGYFIDNSGKKTECLIKNNDWRNNPTNFEYKLSEESDIKKGTIETIQEFGVYNEFKYINRKVKIDRSSPNTDKLSNNRLPIFNQEELFLKVLIEGKANLYYYEDGGIRRYFYNVDNSKTEQLIFKIYKSSSIAKENNQFRQQLWNDLKCNDIKTTERLQYNKGSLVKFFIQYNQCHSSELINYEEKKKRKKRDIFSLNIRPRIRYSSLKIRSDNFNTFWSNTDLAYNFGFGLGLDAEFILPFNMNKWSITLEPTYQRYNTKESTDFQEHIFATVVTVVTTTKYHSIEIPMSLRYYIFLKNNNTKFFINVGAVFDIGINSSIKYEISDGTFIDSFTIRPNINIAIGAGVKLNNKYSIELRHLTNRDILVNNNIDAEHRIFSVIFGYTLFKK